VRSVQVRLQDKRGVHVRYGDNEEVPIRPQHALDLLEILGHHPERRVSEAHSVRNVHCDFC